ncbi:hypothetical protein C4D60_Mb11t16280 [Musa balbisiana]|uniref:Uncharacterized protein n=1 Tax=Musa balbisiana TaxID=52838 RepID=A0A4S8J627_MUSBA|nr:hypothetical protein C4D60_Mb11t16280 [Musa balbisiana]
MIQQSVRKEGLSRFRITSQHAVGLSQRIGGTDVSENNGSHVNVQGENLIFLLVEHNTMEINATTVIL